MNEHDSVLALVTADFYGQKRTGMCPIQDQDHSRDPKEMKEM